MSLLINLPVEILLAIVQDSDAVSALSSIARTCRHLNTIFNPILHRRALQDKDCWAWAIERDRSDIFERILAHQASPRWVFRPHDLNLCLQEALKAGSFRVGNLLLDMGAEVLYSADSRRSPHCDETAAWLSARPHLHCSLALAARSRYHLTFWYRKSKPYTSEIEFWKWKKRAMEKILHQLRKNFNRSYLEDPELGYEEYQRELDIALVEAAGADAHSIELMRFLLVSGANVNADVNINSHVVGQMWRSALDEEVPGLFRAKVEFLINHGINTTRVWSWHGFQTPIEFFLKKLQWAYMYSGDVSFVDRTLYFTDILESLGCLQWSQVKFENLPANNGSLPDIHFHDLNESGAGELQRILTDDDERLSSLREALRSRLRRKQLENCAETTLVERPRPDVEDTEDIQDLHARCLELPKGIERLEELHGAWLGGRQFLNVVQELMAVSLVCKSRPIYI